MDGQWAWIGGGWGFLSMPLNTNNKVCWGSVLEDGGTTFLGML